MFLNEGAKLQNGRYLILRELGSGGMGTAYLARDTALDREVVVKTSRDDLEPEQLRFEAKMPARLRHPNLPVIFDYIRGQAGQAYIVMEYIRGETLDDIVKPHGRCEVEQVLTWIPKLLSALQHLHTQNPPLIHRDVKPANICLTPNSELFLLDFGIARHLDGSDTRVEAQARSDGYAPIEQYAGDSRLRNWASVEQYVVALRQAGYATAPYTDIYSFGATLYFLLTAKNPPTAVLRVLGDPLEAISDLNESVPELLAEAITKALALHPRDRFQSADDMQQFLAPILAIQAPPKSAASAHRPVPFMSDDLPSGFVPRPAEFEATLSAVLADAGGVVTLQGAGGFGKTTLAQAICHDQRVWTAFPDGILWVTLGEDPNPLVNLSKLYTHLTHKRPNFVDVEDASIHLADTLDAKRCLLVIDDIWNEAHLRYFMRGGPQCVHLLTTRLIDMMPAKTTRLDVGEMQPGEAISLLLGGLDTEIDENDRLTTLTNRIGRWPLLLKLANGALQHRVIAQKQAIEDALEYIERAFQKRGPAAFDSRKPIARDQAVTRTLQISFEQLTGEEYHRFTELSIFSKDTEIPVTTVGNLWRVTGGLDDLDTEELLDDLHRLSLVSGFDLASNTIRLHDVIVDYLVYKHRADQQQYHRFLLDAHRPTQPSAVLPDPECQSLKGASYFLWADLRLEDGYMWRNLGYHLINAGLKKEFLATIKNPRFLAIKTFLVDIPLLENDLSLAAKIFPDDAIVVFLQQVVVQHSHLLGVITELNEQIEFLYERLRFIPELKTLCDSLKRYLTPPYLTFLQKPPDFPESNLVRTLHPISGFEAVINSCTFNWQGTLIASGHQDRTVQVRRVQDGLVVSQSDELLRTRKVFFYDKSFCIFCPVDNFILYDNQIYLPVLWNWKTGQIVTIFDPDDIVYKSPDPFLGDLYRSPNDPLPLLEGDSGANCGNFSRDGNTIVLGYSDGKLRVFETVSGTHLYTITGHTDHVRDCVFNADGSELIATSDDGTVRMWKVVTGEEIFRADFLAMCLSYDGSYFTTASSRNQNVDIYELRTGHKISTLSNVQGKLKFDRQNQLIAAVGRTITLWDVASGQQLLVFSIHSTVPTAADFSPSGNLMVSGVSDTLKIWRTDNIRDLAQTSSRKKISSAQAINCHLSQDGRMLFVAHRTGIISVWDSQSQEMVQNIDFGHISFDVRRFSRDSQKIVSASQKVVKVYDIFSGKELLTYSAHDSEVLDIALSPVNNLAVSIDENNLRLWDIQTGIEQAVWKLEARVVDDNDYITPIETEGHSWWRPIARCSISPNGKFISASVGSALWLYCLDQPERAPIFLDTQVIFEFSIKWLTFSPDSRILLCGSNASISQFWETTTGNELTFVGISGPAQFSDDGSYLTILTTWTSGERITILGVDRQSGITETSPPVEITGFCVERGLRDCVWHPDGERLFVVGESGVYFLHFVKPDPNRSKEFISRPTPVTEDEVPF